MSMENATSAKRIAFLDIARGIAILYMLFYHVMYDLARVFAVGWAQPIFASQKNIVKFDSAAFVLMAGMTICHSRNPAKRGARLLCLAAIFTMVTVVIFPGYGIYFGMLHLISISMLVWSVVGDYVSKIPWWVGCIVFAVLYVFTYNCKYGYFGIEGIYTIPVPEILKYSSLMYPFGFVELSYASVDYVPLLPGLFLFLCGASIGKLLTKELPEGFYKSRCKPLEWIGRNSLKIYIIHQPLVFAVLYFIFEIL